MSVRFEPAAFGRAVRLTRCSSSIRTRSASERPVMRAADPRPVKVRWRRSTSQAPNVSSRSSPARSISTSRACRWRRAVSSISFSSSAARSAVQAPVAASSRRSPSAVAVSATVPAASVLTAACSASTTIRIAALEPAMNPRSYWRPHGALRTDRALAAGCRFHDQPWQQDRIRRCRGRTQRWHPSRPWRSRPLQTLRRNSGRYCGKPRIFASGR